MAHQFGEYEIVELEFEGETVTASVRGWNETGETYELVLPNGDYLEAEEHELISLNRFEAPFIFQEVVEILPHADHQDTEYQAIVGSRGVVGGIAAPAENGRWGFSVVLQSGECWYFQDDQLRNVGMFVTEDQMRGPNATYETVRIRYNPETEETTVIAGDATLLNRGPVPLRIDLSSV